MSISSRDQEILAVAKRETQPHYTHEFEPITKGFLFAATGLATLGVLALFYIVFSKVTKSIWRKPLTSTS